MSLTYADFFSSMLRIRRFEETVMDNFSKGVFFGTTHAYIGQEANAVGVLSCLNEEDIVFSNHRCHGHFLAYGGKPHQLFAELMGKATGVCGGRGGSQHLHWRNFFSNGVQGGIVPIATGMALAEKLKGSHTVALAFLGDGTLGEGVVYESLNLAALFQAPIMFIVENNHIAQTTRIDQALSGTIKARFQAFNIPFCELDSSDVLEIAPIAKQLISEIRITNNPQALILNTIRFAPHSKGDDTRPSEEILRFMETRDPIRIHAPRIKVSILEEISEQINIEISAAFQQALLDPFS